eukprot:1093240-Amphidinium_carterae.2
MKTVPSLHVTRDTKEQLGESPAMFDYTFAENGLLAHKDDSVQQIAVDKEDPKYDCSGLCQLGKDHPKGTEEELWTCGRS